MRAASLTHEAAECDGALHLVNHPLGAYYKGVRHMSEVNRISSVKETGGFTTVPSSGGLEGWSAQTA